MLNNTILVESGRKITHSFLIYKTFCKKTTSRGTKKRQSSPPLYINPNSVAGPSWLRYFPPGSPSRREADGESSESKPGSL